MRAKVIFFCLCLVVPLGVFSQGAWTQKASYPLAGRQYAVGFSVGNYGYYAFGCGSGFPNSVNLVQYNPATDSWTQKTSFAGGTRIISHVMVIDTLAYFVSGSFWSGAPDDYTGYSDVWVYNPYNDSWTQKNNFPGTPRHGGFSYSYSGKGYFGLGIDDDLNFLDDFWEYNPLTDNWTQKTTFPGIHRKSGAYFSVNKDGYVGLGYDNTSTALSDFWRFDASQNTWTQMANFPGNPRCWLSSFTMNNKGYIVAGYLLNSSTRTKEFWEYEPNYDVWAAMPDFSGAARAQNAGFSINGLGYNGLGYSTAYLTDFWVYTSSVGFDQSVNNAERGIKVYPNPASDQFDIEVPKLPKNNNTLAVVDASARIIMTVRLNGNPQLVSMDCSSWAQGKYFLVLISGQEKWISSVVVQ